MWRNAAVSLKFHSQTIKCRKETNWVRADILYSIFQEGTESCLHLGPRVTNIFMDLDLNRWTAICSPCRGNTRRTSKAHKKSYANSVTAMDGPEMSLWAKVRWEKINLWIRNSIFRRKGKPPGKGIAATFTMFRCQISEATYSFVTS